MSKREAAPAIDPDRLYRITFSKSFEYEGEKFIPRTGSSHKVSGAMLELIKDHLDEYEAI
ncbi:hypothetical protein J2045_003334 [Peteryoungia aggregata LMG 23059]|uniref:Uncharacterized protein n=1 Tax=Peteryoungia aggregata LMG 23059 TaxID=1368425 RepID=A0ABU0GC39_9HYPH|nr:hypothetical protein [Peteryoungia aggregata]MDQ0422286.1 hypothetical protein [Peteryoungia aggregata LMG 23059]